MARPKAIKPKLDTEPIKTEPFDYFDKKPVNVVDKPVDNSPRGIPHKHLVNTQDEKKNTELSMRESSQDGRSGLLPTVSREIYSELEKIAQAYPDSTNENELQKLYARLRQEGQNHKDALRTVRESIESSASRGLHQAVTGNVVMPTVSSSASCKCGHDQEMHYGGEKGHCNRMNCECLQFI